MQSNARRDFFTPGWVQQSKGLLLLVGSNPSLGTFKQSIEDLRMLEGRAHRANDGSRAKCRGGRFLSSLLGVQPGPFICMVSMAICALQGQGRFVATESAGQQSLKYLLSDALWRKGALLLFWRLPGFVKHETMGLLRPLLPFYSIIHSLSGRSEGSIEPKRCLGNPH